MAKSNHTRLRHINGLELNEMFDLINNIEAEIAQFNHLEGIEWYEGLKKQMVLKHESIKKEWERRYK